MGSEWHPSGLVLTTAVGTPIDPRNLTRHFDRVRVQAGAPTLRFHDLRHTAVSLLLDLGVPPHVVREIVGHADVQITMAIHAHASDQEKRSALRRLGDSLC
jgi:integrase